MSADQAGRVHRVIGEVDGSEDNLVFVLYQVLREERAAGWDEGYSDATRGRYEADRLADRRKEAAAAAAGTEGDA